MTLSRCFWRGYPARVVCLTVSRFHFWRSYIPVESKIKTAREREINIARVSTASVPWCGELMLQKGKKHLKKKKKEFRIPLVKVQMDVNGLFRSTNFGFKREWTVRISLKFFGIFILELKWNISSDQTYSAR